jgi:hypothetical protein
VVVVLEFRIWRIAGWAANCAVCCVLWCAGDYWGWWKPARSYHHTGPVSTFYALREALAIVGEEGLPAMWDRHLQVRGVTVSCCCPAPGG